jgi:hypothetical protein
MTDSADKRESTETGEPNFEILPLYRYVSAQGDEKQRWIEDVFLRHKLYFSSRTSFNDPFDCIVPSLLGTQGTLLKRFVEERISKLFAHASAAEQIRMMSKGLSADFLEGLRKDLQTDVDGAGILCLSKVRDDILMWSHYADKHNGLCLEFDGSANCLFFGEAQPVQYSEYTPLPLDDDSGKQIERIVLTKATHWSYEQEYRIVRPNQAGTLMEFPAALLTGVIFGYGMPDELRQKIRSWAAAGNSRVAFFEALPKVGQFGLDVVLLPSSDALAGRGADEALHEAPRPLSNAATPGPLRAPSPRARTRANSRKRRR